MLEITKELCAYCLSKATIIRDTNNYKVGLCNKHECVTNEEIEEVLGKVIPKKRGVNILLK